MKPRSRVSLIAGGKGSPGSIRVKRAGNSRVPRQGLWKDWPLRVRRLNISRCLSSLSVSSAVAVSSNFCANDIGDIGKYGRRPLLTTVLDDEREPFKIARFHRRLNFTCRRADLVATDRLKADWL